ncbi:DUF1338 family protein [Aidingimonas halophila]|uniref:2-oxoadipate dioxygenase/decarboxylase n=1 Tax=Aidingimonas halophila TaxID=574349 RepID=A0A1H3BW52_9GAMM|nr:DUF1338 family protein [Aidingimonas halophila]GHC27147.1 hypothetical protein GCM10008094_18310 [Aidingimonas halophila]SDX45399.1 protein of unknown function [Aidingimonas halophila]
MQRQEFLQQLWLDYIHRHPDIGALRLWPLDSIPEYFVILTLNHRQFSIENLMPTLGHFGYRRVERYAMADRGLLISLMAPPDHGAWLILCELQLGTLTRDPRHYLETLIAQAPASHFRGQDRLCHGRPWPMPDRESYRKLQTAHPMAAWLAVTGPRLHHTGFDCERLGSDLPHLDQQMQQAGYIGHPDRHHGVFPISPLLNYRYYPSSPQRLIFSGGDEHRESLGGIALVQKCLPSHQERAAELLLPLHTRCEIA